MTTTGPRSGGSRFFASPPRAPRSHHARPAKCVAGQKTASRNFFRTAPKTRPEIAAQTLGTHQENYRWAYDFALGCAVGPNRVPTVTIGPVQFVEYITPSAEDTAYINGVPARSSSTSSSGLAPLTYDDYANSSFGRTPRPSDFAAIQNAARETFGNDVFQKPLTTLAAAGAQTAALVGAVYTGVAAVPVVARGVSAFNALPTEAKVWIVAGAIRLATYGDFKGPALGRAGASGLGLRIVPVLTETVKKKGAGTPPP